MTQHLLQTERHDQNCHSLEKSRAPVSFSQAELHLLSLPNSNPTLGRYFVGQPCCMCDILRQNTWDVAILQHPLVMKQKY